MAKTKKATKTAKKKLKADEATHIPSRLEKMERRFDDLFSHHWHRPQHWDRPDWVEKTPHLESKIPKVDVVDRHSKILLLAEMPGVDKKDIEITTTENSVTIKGSTQHEEKKEGDNYRLCEITQGSFLRTISLPCEVKNNKAKATFRNGLLKLVLPKVVQSRRKKIAIE